MFKYVSTLTEAKVVRDFAQSVFLFQAFPPEVIWESPFMWHSGFSLLSQNQPGMACRSTPGKHYGCGYCSPHIQLLIAGWWICCLVWDTGDLWAWLAQISYMRCSCSRLWSPKVNPNPVDGQRGEERREEEMFYAQIIQELNQPFPWSGER